VKRVGDDEVKEDELDLLLLLLLLGEDDYYNNFVCRFLCLSSKQIWQGKIKSTDSSFALNACVGWFYFRSFRGQLLFLFLFCRVFRKLSEAYKQM
jgi:hypothetical protein